MSSFCSQDDIFNRSYQAFNNISPLSDRFSKFLREYAKDEENDDTKSWSKIKDNCSNKNGDSLKTSLTESSSGSLNTSFLSSQEATKRSNTDNSLIKNQCTLIRNNLKLLRSQVDFLLKFNASEIEGLDGRVRETVKKELESLLLWLGPNLPRSEEIMQNQIVCRSPGIKSTPTKVFSSSPEMVSNTLQEDQIDSSILLLKETCSFETDENNAVSTNIHSFMKKMEDDFECLTNEFKDLAKRIEKFEQLNWKELFHNFRIKIQEKTVKMCISYIIQKLDQNNIENNRW
ncbi:hypothetical protein MS3_00008768 [Schistosoma haematobium]|uniref:Uncharacterized protein n=1 Tax=Schistosoma haematobium TaxID=6185 RepID=A0A922LFH0_SCHHA|nr:hypothetical protein MS3_00008768 [Schistosoma haematobium]KAH9581710.1 hypothetical protein MS3_00008768 [Schistosoma haematobium]CAH8622749.1 unnamed protein product [Schistosoma haematobium]